jgi:diguanylate cyclase (GGDEF)-like protein
VVPYPFFPAGIQELVYLATGAGVEVAVLFGIRRHGLRPTTPWYLIAAAYGCYVVGDALSYVDLTQAPGVLPWASDLAYLCYYPLVTVALALIMRRHPLGKFAAWLDAAIWTVGAGVLLWKLALEGSQLPAHLGIDWFVAVAYPLMDLVVLLLLVRTVTGMVLDNTALLLLASGLAAQLVADVFFLGDFLGAGYVEGGSLDVGWLVSYVLVIAAGLHPSLARATEVSSHPRSYRLGGWRIPLLLVPALVGPGMLVRWLMTGVDGRDVKDVAVATTAVVVTLVLAALRGSGLIWLANRRAAELQIKVDHDSLTGLASRDGFLRLLAVGLEDATESSPVSVLFLDLDDFKTVNDTQGHEIGDLLLIEVARRLRSAEPGNRAIARFGGDEFAMLVPQDEVDTVVRRVLRWLERPAHLGGRDLELSVSIGSASGHRGVPSAELLRRVDIAMYESKRSRRSWTPYEPRMSEQLCEAVSLRERLAVSLAAGEITPWFQPVVDLTSGTLRGFEALARWMPDGQQPVPSGRWLPLAEDSDLITSVDRVVLRAALDQLGEWRRRYGATDLHMAVNLSGRTLRQPGIEDEILEAVRSAGVPPGRLFLEITEGVQIEDDDVGVRLQRLRSHGIRIALDDFGTGWSSLTYLRRFPVDRLKLDRSVTGELGEAPDACAIPAAVVQLAAALSLDVVAEGVETPGQRDALIALGFTLSQGYLFAPALPAADLDERVASCSTSTVTA